MPLIAVTLPYAVSIRDFVHTGVLGELLLIPDAQVDIYTLNPDLPEFDSLRNDCVRIIGMQKVHNGRIEGFLKGLYPFLFHDIFVNVQLNTKSPFKRAMAGVLVRIRRILGTRTTLKLYARLMRMVSTRNSDERQIKGEPDLVISTRSLVKSLDYPLLLEAIERKLPHIVAASSWDNFTTKGFFPFPVSKTVVWNRQMANELREIFEVPEQKIVVAGYPRRKLLGDAGDYTSAQEYLATLGLSEYRRFVLYSASYGELTRNHPDEAPKEFQLIREVALELAKILPDDTCIIVRLHPFSQAIDETFFDGLPRVRPFVPGRRDRYVERVMNREDEMHLAAQIKFSECVISMASTMTIDALSMGKPIINLAFDPKGGTGAMITRFYGYNHFRDLLKAVKPPMAARVEDVVAFVERCLAGDKDPRIDREAFERLYVPTDSNGYAQVVRQTAEEVLGSAG